jgi:rhodanese-related sulfurtransferase
VDNKDAVLIDVREPWELETFGSFPDAVNIPLGEVHDALQMTEEDFQSKYSRGKPSADDKIVMYCMGGIRSRRALNSALSLGYNK